MSLERVALLVTAIGSLTALITFFVSRRDKAKDPLPKQSAEVALAANALGLVEASAKRLDLDVIRLTKRLDEQDAKIARLEEQREVDNQTIEAQQVEIAGLKRRVTGMIQDRDDLLAYVVTIQRWVAGGSRPPAPTPPRHLADVLPPWESGDGVEKPAQEDS